MVNVGLLIAKSAYWTTKGKKSIGNIMKKASRRTKELKAQKRAKKEALAKQRSEKSLEKKGKWQ